MCNAHYKRWQRGASMDKPVQNRGAGWISTHGYRYVGKRAQHRILVERAVGRELEFNEVIHHLDEDKLNNDMGNLSIMSRGAHARLHNAGLTNEQRAQRK